MVNQKKNAVDAQSRIKLMLVKEFLEWAEKFQTEETSIMLAKGQEYTISDSDKFKNFKSLAERLKVTPELIAMVYLLKHIDSITNYVVTGATSSNEPFEGRIQDARNYLLLLAGIDKETQDGKQEK